MREIKGFIIGVLTTFAVIFAGIRWAWKKVGMTEDFVIPHIKESIIAFVTRLFYGDTAYLVKRRPYPRYTSYYDRNRKDGDKYTNPAWKGGDLDGR